MEYNNILTRIEGQIARIILNREEKLNTINVQMVREIMDFISSIEENNDIRVLIISGGKNFSAGADVTTFGNINSMDALEFHKALNSLALKFRESKKIIIAMINGYCLGGGFELSLSTDIRIASRKSILGQPEINLGINAGAGGNVILPRIVGRGRALLMILTGEKIDAEKAYNYGIVDILADHENLVTDTDKLAMKIAQKPFNASYLAKMAVNYGSELNIKSALEYEASIFGLLFSTGETKEKVNNFINKKR